jgi:hypothetical protein
VPAGPEVYCGGKVDPDYGPLVCLGWGGSRVQEEPAVACAEAPVDPAVAEELIGAIAGLGGVIGAEMSAALGQMLVTLSELVARLPIGTSVDLNPVILSDGDWPVAVDALITRAPVPLEVAEGLS